MCQTVSRLIIELFYILNYLMYFYILYLAIYTYIHIYIYVYISLPCGSVIKNLPANERETLEMQV